MGRRVSAIQQSSGGGGSSTIRKDPFEQPCFSHFGGYYSNSKGWFTLDHNLNMSNVMIGGNSGYNSWTCDNNSYSSEFSNNIASDSGCCGNGGGILVGSSDGIIRGSTIINNTALYLNQACDSFDNSIK